MNNPRKKVLVAGGAGFIGSNFLTHIYNKYPEYELLNLDSLTYAGNLENLREIESGDSKKSLLKKRYIFLKGDICNVSYVRRVFNKYKPDIVINFAAESHVDRSIVDSRYFFRTNLIGVHNLVDRIIECKIPKFIQISTDEVYGEVLKGESDEQACFRPSNPYSASKAAADLLVQSYIRTHKIPAIILRGSNNFGPFQYPEKLMPLAITNLLEGEGVLIHGNGQQRRRWLHVNDFCEAIDLVIHKAQDFSIYNVAGIEMSNIDIIKKICRALNRDFSSEIYFIQDRPGSDMRYAPESKKIERELGWKITHKVSDEIPKVVEWYVDNEKWWKKIKSKKEFKIRYTKQRKSEY